MIDVGMKLRKAYFTALNGNVSYAGNTIPFVDEKLDANISENTIYVLMKEQIEDLQSTSNKTTFTNECLLRMEVVNQRQGTNEKEIVEDVSNQILTILFPQKNRTSLVVDAPLSLTYARFVNAEYTPLVQNDLGFVITKILTFKNRLIQQ